MNAKLRIVSGCIVCSLLVVGHLEHSGLAIGLAFLWGAFLAIAEHFTGFILGRTGREAQEREAYDDGFDEGYDEGFEDGHHCPNHGRRVVTFDSRAGLRPDDDKQKSN